MKLSKTGGWILIGVIVYLVLLGWISCGIQNHYSHRLDQATNSYEKQTDSLQALINVQSSLEKMYKDKDIDLYRNALEESIRLRLQQQQYYFMEYDSIQNTK